MDHIAHLGIRGEAGSDEVTRTIAFLKDHQTVIDPTQSWNELLGHAAGTPIAAFQPGVLKVPAPIERGKRADMVVLNANPLDAIRNIRSVRWTISGGRVYDAPALWTSVRFQP